MFRVVRIGNLKGLDSIFSSQILAQYVLAFVSQLFELILVGGPQQFCSRGKFLSLDAASVDVTQHLDSGYVTDVHDIDRLAFVFQRIAADEHGFEYGTRSSEHDPVRRDLLSGRHEISKSKPRRNRFPPFCLGDDSHRLCILHTSCSEAVEKSRKAKVSYVKSFTHIGDVAAFYSYAIELLYQKVM
ncbi:unnamed protein product [Trichogramma brassicae]|uniref:Uncharacterized protein n=1 Tax=Trichogramma brassicae TaxID=86971 RepID=A0A6H5I833_9HYME|nr:unnamed protein product [Trichogramma brassicae]